MSATNSGKIYRTLLGRRVTSDKYRKNLSKLNLPSSGCEIFDTAFVHKRSAIQEKSEYILLCARLKSSTYCVRTKPCKYFESGRCQFKGKCRFFHDARSP